MNTAGKNEEKDAQELKLAARYQALERAIRNYRGVDSDLLRERLEWFRDQKFGLMVHWGLYNLVGIKESWPLTDREWTKWQFKPGTPNIEVKKMYAQLHKGFNPLRFDPEEWAEIAENAGFKYLVFTTKHHDGFCMWDTKTTDYKVTGPEVPWRTNQNADITKALFNAFRARGMGIWAYFSRADFDCPYYWEPGERWKDGILRLPSYDPDEKPEVWRKFQDYVFAQLKELVTEYGRIDCLWYDGGCDGSKLGLPGMTEELRKIQPWMLGVIRGGNGICEDFITPELTVPERPIDIPWETCTVMGKPHLEYGHSDHVSFGYSFDQDYMSAKEVAHLLLDIVAKGGNLALNLAPQPDGRLPYRALRELEVLAEWMKVFGQAIYSTRVVAPYRVKHWAFTCSKDKKYVNAFYLYDDKEQIQAKCFIPYSASRVCRATELRSGAELHFVQKENGVEITMPDERVGTIGDIADCIVLETE